MTIGTLPTTTTVAQRLLDAARAQALVLSSLSTDTIITDEEVVAIVTKVTEARTIAGVISDYACLYGDYAISTTTRMCWALAVVRTIPQALWAE